MPTRNLGARCISDEQLLWPETALVDYHCLPSDCKEFLKLGSVKGTHWLGWSWIQLEPWPQPHGLEHDRE